MIASSWKRSSVNKAEPKHDRKTSLEFFRVFRIASQIFPVTQSFNHHHKSERERGEKEGGGGRKTEGEREEKK